LKKKLELVCVKNYTVLKAVSSI